MVRADHICLDLTRLHTTRSNGFAEGRSPPYPTKTATTPKSKEVSLPSMYTVALFATWVRPGLRKTHTHTKVGNASRRHVAMSASVQQSATSAAVDADGEKRPLSKNAMKKQEKLAYKLSLIHI